MMGRRPSASQRADRRARKKIINEGFSPVIIKDLDAYRGWISFHSLTFLRPNKNTRSTTFIVRTRKPIRWGDFIERVTPALSDLLV